jgi:hypothetical protein
LQIQTSFATRRGSGTPTATRCTMPRSTSGSSPVKARSISSACCGHCRAASRSPSRFPRQRWRERCRPRHAGSARSGRRARCLPPRMADHQRVAAARTAVPGKRPRPCRLALAHRRPRLPSLRGHPDLAGPADSGVRPVPITMLRTPAAAGAGGSHGTGWGHDGEPRHGALPAAAAGAQPAVPHRADPLGDLARICRRGRR